MEELYDNDDNNPGKHALFNKSFDDFTLNQEYCVISTQYWVIEIKL